MNSEAKVYVLIPVFNRLAHTVAIVDCLRLQKNVDVQIVVIDDGSTDGTAEFLSSQPDIMTINGNGNLFWGGSIHIALEVIHPLLRPGDFFVFMNNDTKIDENFLSILVATSLCNGRAAVGSAVRADAPPYEMLSIGPISNLWNMAIWDIQRDLPEAEKHQPREVYEVDFLSGRGSLYPGEVLDRIGYMRPSLLPHYHADYEFADRVRRSGCKLLVATGAVTYSTEGFGNEGKQTDHFWRRKLGKHSHENVIHRVTLFCLIGTSVQRGTAIPRLIWASIGRTLHPVRVLLLRLTALLVLASKAMLRSRLGAVLSYPVSSVARARVAAALERRGKRREEPLQVYTAMCLKEMRGGIVLLLGRDADRYEAFFQGLLVNTKLWRGDELTEAADLVFCVSDSFVEMPKPDELARLVRLGGVIFCTSAKHTLPPEKLIWAKKQFLAMPSMELLIDHINQPPSNTSAVDAGRQNDLRSDTKVECAMGYLQFFAVRKLSRS